MTVSDVRRDLMNTRTIVSEVHQDVTTTYTMVSEIHRNMLKSPDGAGDQRRLVSNIRTLSHYRMNKRLSLPRLKSGQ